MLLLVFELLPLLPLVLLPRLLRRLEGMSILQRFQSVGLVLGHHAVNPSAYA